MKTYINIWRVALAVYAITGAILCLIMLAVLSYPWIDTWRSSEFVLASYGIVSLVGAGLTSAYNVAAYNRPTLLREGIIAGTIIAWFAWAQTVFDFRFFGRLPGESLSTSLSTVFVCMVGAFAGSQLANRWAPSPGGLKHALLRISVTGLVILGATVGHTLLATWLLRHSQWDAFAGAMALFSGPVIASWVIQRCNPKQVDNDILWAILCLCIAVLAAVLFNTPKPSLLALTFIMSLLVGGLGFLLCVIGMAIARSSRAWQHSTVSEASLPEAKVLITQ